MKITIIIPVYNEIKGINSVIDQLKKFLQSRTNYDFIIVNDGSTDGTAEILSKNSHDKIAVVHKKNGGYGSAIKYGSKYVETEYFGIIDADNTYPINQFDEMIKDLNSFDMVIGSRTSLKSSIPLIKKIPKFFLRIFSSYVSNKKILDFNSGMRLFKTSTFRKFISFLPDGFSLTTTLSIIFSSLNYKIKFYEIDYFDRTGESKIRPFKDTINFFLTISRLGMIFNPFRLYGPFIIFFSLVGTSLMIYRFFYGEGLLVLTILCFLISLFLLFFCLISSGISQLIKLKIDEIDD